MRGKFDLQYDSPLVVQLYRPYTYENPKADRHDNAEYQRHEGDCESRDRELPANQRVLNNKIPDESYKLGGQSKFQMGLLKIPVRMHLWPTSRARLSRAQRQAVLRNSSHQTHSATLKIS
jgi:hypothetical protein